MSAPRAPTKPCPRCEGAGVLHVAPLVTIGCPACGACGIVRADGTPLYGPAQQETLDDRH